MRKFYKYLVLVVIGFAFILVGCGSSLKMPDKNATIYGNGGSVVQKGDYLYFANAYTSYNNLSGENAVKSGDKELGIYRTKLSSENNKEIDFDENGFAKNVEQVALKLAGFESLGMYIVGEHLFFATPNTHKTSTNQNRYDLVSFFSVKLDGSGLKELYTTFSGESSLPSAISKLEWKIYSVGNTNYLVTVEQNKIIRHTITKNKLSDKTVLAENVKNAILPESILSDFDKQLFFTADFTEHQRDELGYSGIILKSVNLKSEEIQTQKQFHGPSVSFNLIAHQNSRVFYSVKGAHLVNEGLYVIGEVANEMQIASTTTRTNLFFMGEDKPLIFESKGSIFAQKLTLNNMPGVANFDFEDLDIAGSKVLFIDGDYIYYTQNNALLRISYKDKTAQTIISENFDGDKIDFDGRYVYVYKTIENAETSNQYLQRVKVSTAETSEKAKFEIVSYVLDKDKNAVIKAIEDKDKEEN